ncbi:APC family permease [Candidatus Nanohalococcus occultus]|uniref:APC family permease n=1 Tax=Candidatus Nanohalococcus occultus TaxID=2978047 RepID=UPI0039DFAA39
MGDLSLTQAVAMGVGGIVGGGIFAVLGVAARLSGNAAFLTYLLAGTVALLSGHSYYQMTAATHEEGGSFTFLEHYLSNKNIAGVVGWVLLVGYIGTMAMYAYAFGSFAAGLFGFTAESTVRKLLSSSIIAVFIGVNMLGADETGTSEDLLVYLKVLILSVFGAAGIWAILTRSGLTLFEQGVFNHGVLPPIMAIGAIFVSFEGFQLLTYEYRDMENGLETLKKAILISIILSTALYVLIAALTTSLATPTQIITHKETILAFVASKVFVSSFASSVMAALIYLAALFSTASAINATLFGTARFSHKMASDNELPNVFSFRNKKGVPSYSLLIIGSLTVLFSFLGSLEEITTFASVTFIVVFSAVNYIALKEAENQRNKLIAGLGIIGTVGSFLLLVNHLYVDKPQVLVFIAVLFSALGILETLYFEREGIEKDLEELEGGIGLG